MFQIFKNILTADNKVSTNAYINYEGEFDFFIKPKIKGKLPFQSTTIKIEAYDSSDDLSNPNPRGKLKIHCKWYRVVGDRNYQIHDNPDEIYHFNAYDIGSTIKCAVQIRPIKTSRMHLKFRK